MLIIQSVLYVIERGTLPAHAMPCVSDFSLLERDDDDDNLSFALPQAPCKKYFGHSAHVTCVRFSHDDHYLLSAGGDDSWYVRICSHPHTDTPNVVAK